MQRMSQDPSEPSASAPAAGSPAVAPTPARKTAPASRGIVGALALLLALVALALGGYLAWMQWQAQRGDALGQLQQRVATLETTLSRLDAARGDQGEQLQQSALAIDALRQQVLGQAERLRDADDALARLSERSQSGHAALLLDEVESLLRMAQERYQLFHDARGAAAAYGQADAALAELDDGAYAGLRQSVDAERAALEKAVQATPADTMQRLQQLRGALATLPLKPLDEGDAAPAQGAWARIRQALLGVISVRRDDGAPLAVADARFARELAGLDLALAQAALLDDDSAAALAALQRAAVALASQFDDASPEVRQARATLAGVIASIHPAGEVTLGAALAELRDLRQLHALAPAPAASSAPVAPAPAASVHGAAR